MINFKMFCCLGPHEKLWFGAENSDLNSALSMLGEFLGPTDREYIIKGGRGVLVIERRARLYSDTWDKMVFNGCDELIHLLTLAADKALKIRHAERTFRLATAESPN